MRAVTTEMKGAIAIMESSSVHLSDIAIAGLAIILAMFLAIIVRLVLTGGGDRPPPWQRRHRNYRIDR